MQCRERWINYLDPHIKNGGYTIEEDRDILRHQRNLGDNWAQIASYFPRRTEYNIKLRFKMLQRQGFHEEAKYCLKKSSPPQGSGTKDHIRLRQVAAQAMIYLQKDPDSIVYVPGSVKLPTVILKGDTMDTSNIPHFEVPLYLTMNCIGLSCLVDSNNQVVWVESGNILDTCKPLHPLVWE